MAVRLSSMPPRTPRLPGAGDVIAAKYRLERLLKQGGMGAVWIATHLGLDERVAVKFMDPRRVSSTEARIRFTREAKAAAQIRSKNIVQILDHGVDAGVPYIAMELLAGEDLGVRLRRAGRLSIGEASALLDDIGHALDRAHAAGIVHRDLKPENIFLAKDGDHEIPKILDFGIALEVQEDASDDSAMTQEGVILGTPYFMSPEQVRGRTNIDHRSDLWSVGVILFRAITGIRPFGRGAPADVIVQICSDPIPRASVVARDLPDEVDRFFEKALARDVAKRFSSAKEMAAAFAEIARIAEAAEKTQQDLVIALGDRRSSRTQRKGPPPLPPTYQVSKTLPSPSSDPDLDLLTLSAPQPAEALATPPLHGHDPAHARAALDPSQERPALPPVAPSSASEPTPTAATTSEPTPPPTSATTLDPTSASTSAPTPTPSSATASEPHDAPSISPAMTPAPPAADALSAPPGAISAKTGSAPPVIALPAAASSPPDAAPRSVAPRGQDSRSGVWIALALLLIAAVVGVGFRDKLFPPPPTSSRDPAGATTIVLTAGTVVLVGPAGVRAPAPTATDAPTAASASATAAPGATTTAGAPPTASTEPPSATASATVPGAAPSASASAAPAPSASATAAAKPPLTGTLKPPSTTGGEDDPKPPEPTKPPVSSPPKPDPRDLGY